MIMGGLEDVDYQMAALLIGSLFVIFMTGGIGIIPVAIVWYLYYRAKKAQKEGLIK